MKQEKGFIVDIGQKEGIIPSLEQLWLVITMDPLLVPVIGR